MSTTWEYNDLENKHNLYCGKYCMKNLSESLKDHMKNITDFEKKKMLLLTEERKSHQDTKVGYICGKRILKSSLKVQIIGKLEVIAIIQVNIEVQHIGFVI